MVPRVKPKTKPPPVEGLSGGSVACETGCGWSYLPFFAFLPRFRFRSSIGLTALSATGCHLRSVASARRGHALHNGLGTGVCLPPSRGEVVFVFVHESLIPHSLRRVNGLPQRQ